MVRDTLEILCPKGLMDTGKIEDGIEVPVSSVTAVEYEYRTFDYTKKDLIRSEVKDFLIAKSICNGNIYCTMNSDFCQRIFKACSPLILSYATNYTGFFFHRNILKQRPALKSIFSPDKVIRKGRPQEIIKYQYQGRKLGSNCRRKYVRGTYRAPAIYSIIYYPQPDLVLMVVRDKKVQHYVGITIFKDAETQCYDSVVVPYHSLLSFIRVLNFDISDATVNKRIKYFKTKYGKRCYNEI